MQVMSIELEEAAVRLRKELEDVDSVSVITMKCHMLLELHLKTIVENHFFHPEHMIETRIGFHDWVCIARSLCLRKNTLGEWDLILAINTLRNEIAHPRGAERRTLLINRIKEIYIRESEASADKIDADPDELIIINASGHCIGFLAEYEADSKAFRQMVHTLDRSLNPEEPEFELDAVGRHARHAPTGGRG